MIQVYSAIEVSYRGIVVLQFDIGVTSLEKTLGNAIVDFNRAI